MKGEVLSRQWLWQAQQALRFRLLQIDLLKITKRNVE
jgi:hypothetical protein